LRKSLFIAVLIPLILASGWYYFHERTLPGYGPLYREYAYISNGKSNTVTVIDLRSFRPVRTLQVGNEPTGLAANPKRNEVYVVNTGSSNVSVIDAEQNKIVATIGVYGRPYFIDVSPDGHRAYVANSGSDSVSVLDLDRRALAATLPRWRNSRPGSRFARWIHCRRHQSRRQLCLDHRHGAPRRALGHQYLHATGRRRYSARFQQGVRFLFGIGAGCEHRY
jgi:YVTN family beta-propeller protein